MANALKKALIGGAVAAGLGVWAVAPRTFNNKRKNFVPTLPDVLYAHRGLHDAGSGLSQQHAGESGEYIALARRMALRAGYGSIDEPGPLAPENSLAAFAAAAEAGYGIELDVQLTLDNKAVVCHDPDLLRVAGDPRNIRDLTYDELVRIPLFPTAAPGAEVSPLLPGATENPPLVTTPSQAPAGWDDRDEELMQTAAALLDAYQGLYVVESFNPAAMNWYKREHPDVCRGQLAEDTEFTKNPVLWMAGKLMFNEISRPDFVAYDFRNGNGAMLRFVRRMGAMAVAWTVRTSDELAGAQPYFDRFIFEAFVPKQ